MKDAKEIIEEVLKYTGETKNSLGTKIGLLRSQNVYDVVNGKVKTITPELSEKICLKYPEIDRQYLLTGVGELLKPKQAESKDYSQKTTQTKTAESDHRVTNEGFRDKYYNLLENHNEKIQNLIEKVVKALDNINDMSATIKSQQETIRDLTSTAGDKKTASG